MVRVFTIQRWLLHGRETCALHPHGTRTAYTQRRRHRRRRPSRSQCSGAMPTGEEASGFFFLTREKRKREGEPRRRMHAAQIFLASVRAGQGA